MLRISQSHCLSELGVNKNNKCQRFTVKLLIFMVLIQVTVFWISFSLLKAKVFFFLFFLLFVCFIVVVSAEHNPKYQKANWESGLKGKIHNMERQGYSKNAVIGHINHFYGNRGGYNNTVELSRGDWAKRDHYFTLPVFSFTCRDRITECRKPYVKYPKLLFIIPH